MQRLLFCGVLAVLAAYAQAADVVKYIANNTGVSEEYYLEVIDTALKLTEPKYGAYKIEVTYEQLSSERKHELLVSGERLNVDRIVGFHQTRGPRGALLHINVPLLRGFMGYRIPLIRRESQSRFDQVKNLDDLRKIPLGFGKGWEGYIYRQNGFNLTEPLTFELLLKMLAGGRYDFIPLSAIEIEDKYEIDHQSFDKLIPEQHLLIYTQMPNYFYVSPQVPALAERLNVGLKAMQADGRLNKIFEKYFSARLKRLHLKDRRVIEISNPQDDGSLGGLDRSELEKY